MENRDIHRRSIREMLQTPQRPKASAGDYHLNSDTLLISELEKRCQAQGEELEFYKAKCEQLQQELEKTTDEHKSLVWTLANEKSNMEQLAKNMEVEVEKLSAEHRTALFLSKVEADKWKNAAESVGNEVQLLQGQLKTAKLNKTETIKKLTELQNYKMDAEKQRHNIGVYVRKNQEAFADLRKKMEQLKRAEIQLEDILNAQKKQIAVFQIVVPAMDKQKKLDNAKIEELEKEILRLKSLAVQFEKKVQTLGLQEQSSNILINKLKGENEELLQSVTTMAEAFGSNSENINSVMLSTCKDIFAQHKIPDDNNIFGENNMEM